MSVLNIDCIDDIDTLDFHKIINLSNLDTLNLSLKTYKSDKLPTGIFYLQKLKLLRIHLYENQFLSDINMLPNLVNLETIVLPIDLKNHIDVLEKLPNLNRVTVKIFTDIDIQYTRLNKLKKLKYLTIEEEVSYSTIKKILGMYPSLKISTDKWTSYDFDK